VLQANIAHLIKCMKPTLQNSPGSSMDVTFLSADALSESRGKIEALRMIVRTEPFEGEGTSPIRPAWLSVRKTRDELRPNRLVKRATQFMDMEAEHHPGTEKKVTPELKGKFVSLEGLGKVGGSLAGIWRWHPALYRAGRYPPDILQMGIDWVNDE
jgi:hypothetical protein